MVLHRLGGLPRPTLHGLRHISCLHLATLDGCNLAPRLGLDALLRHIARRHLATFLLRHVARFRLRVDATLLHRPRFASHRLLALRRLALLHAAGRRLGDALVARGIASIAPDRLGIGANR